MLCKSKTVLERQVIWWCGNNRTLCSRTSVDDFKNWVWDMLQAWAKHSGTSVVCAEGAYCNWI